MIFLRRSLGSNAGSPFLLCCSLILNAKSTRYVRFEKKLTQKAQLYFGCFAIQGHSDFVPSLLHKRIFYVQLAHYATFEYALCVAFFLKAGIVQYKTIAEPIKCVNDFECILTMSDDTNNLLDDVFDLKASASIQNNSYIVQFSSFM